MFFGYITNMPETKTDNKITIRHKLLQGIPLEDHEKKSNIKKSEYTRLRQRYNSIYESRFETSDKIKEVLRLKGVL